MNREKITVKNSGFIELLKIDDGLDGSIAVAENFRHIPFAIKRIYYIYNLANQHAVRGKHAHKELEQVLFCINGSCEIFLDDGQSTQTITLDRPHVGIYLGIELWHTMRNFSKDCILLVLASDVYNEKDYIRDYQVFKSYIEARQKL